MRNRLVHPVVSAVADVARAIVQDLRRWGTGWEEIADAVAKAKGKAQASERDALVSLVCEAWRFNQEVEGVAAQCGQKQERKLLRQARWFAKKMDDCLAEARLKSVDLSGMAFNPGMAATAVNLDDFNEGDEVEVESMLSPVILEENGGIRRMGTVMLKRRRQE